MPAGDWFSSVCAALGIQREVAGGEGVQCDISFRMRPAFQEKVIARKGAHLLVQDWMGNIVEISDRYDFSYLRQAKDFVTRRWLRFPVADRRSFEKMKKRYDPDDSARYPEDLSRRLTRLRERTHLTRVAVNGPFWQMREWCGFEPLCYLCADDPSFVREMAEFWAAFVSRVLARVLDAGVLDLLLISEDMAYKGKSMVSPQMVRELLLPVWKRWAGEARQAGVCLVMVDSDGCVDELLPLWIEAGVNATTPVEVAAGCDIVSYRRRCGTKMAYAGGIDKRAIAKGQRAIEEELDRVRPVAEGGYIPSCDHAVPPDVSWQDFLRYAGLLAELTAWR